MPSFSCCHRRPDRARPRVPQQAHLAVNSSSQRRKQNAHRGNVPVEQQKQKKEAALRDTADSESEQEESTGAAYRCEICKKSFKSESTFSQHMETKKHLQKAKSASATAGQRESVGDYSRDPGTMVKASDSRVKQRDVAASEPIIQSSVPSEANDSDSEDADDLVARCAAHKTAWKASRDDDKPSKSSSEEDIAAEPPTYRSANRSAKQATGVSKKEQKRAMQQASLSEKKAQKEQVSDLVKSAKKNLRAANKETLE